MSLYNIARPQKWEQVVGQHMAVGVLQNMLAHKNVPHVVMFTGPTGVGKTTLAKILAGELSTQPPTEINCADVRGIDSVRVIDAANAYKHMDGGNRVWILDEVVQLPKATQQCFLSVLENAKPHVYFLLCTSDTTGLLPTFMGRCFQVNLARLSDSSIDAIVAQSATAVEVSQKVRASIVLRAEGNARKALQMLEAVLAVQGEEAQLAAAGMTGEGQEKQSEFLARALLAGHNWKSLVPIIAEIGNKPDDLETIRRQVLTYMAKVMLSGRHPKARAIIKAFKEPWMWSGQAGLVAACDEVCPG